MLAIGHIFFYEMVGTALLVWAATNDMGAWCVIIVLFLVAAVIGPITGGHVNPAVTMGVLVLNYKDFGQNISWALLAILA